jgi:hypothetical protein
MARLLAFDVALVGLVSVFADGAGCSSTSTNACVGASMKLIQASDYEQSCKVDSDCVAVGEGSACSPCALDCPNAAISKSAYAKYQADFSKTPAASCFAPSSCGLESSPCCIGGTCQMGGQCPGPVSSLTCALGAACSSTELCMGGIVGCESNCQCLNGTWSAPCPTGLPPTGSACTPEGAECGYPTSTNACGADNCYCQGGAWRCGPSCIIGDASTSADTGADAAVVEAATDGATDGGPSDADACAPSGGCTAACVAGRHNVTMMVDGCVVTECCVPDDASAD